ncbi:MAG: DegV family protein [Anaerolineaceae bacterium]
MKIVTDCAADLPAEEIEALGITQVPLYIQFPEGEVSSLDLTPDQFYARLAAMHPEIPSTAQPSSGMFSSIYKKLAEKGKQILSIHISSGLSGTINSARLGSEEVKDADIKIWDTMTLSGGERFQVLAAAWAAKAGWGLKAILERLEAIRKHTEVVYTLDTLEYLAKGGRIGRVQALAGMILKIKPVITVDHEDGKYSTVSKGRSIPQSLELIGDYLQKKSGDKPMWVTILHGKFNESADALAEVLKKKLNVSKLEVMRISPVLGVHTGPAIVGAAVVPMSLMSDLT